MIPSQRKEHFRFSFGAPLDASFSIVKVGDEAHQRNVKSSLGNAKILDISPGGLKIETVFDIPVNKPVALQLAFEINDKNFELTGRVQWQQRRSKNFQYGISLEVTLDQKQSIIDELKKYSKKVHRRA